MLFLKNSHHITTQLRKKSSMAKPLSTAFKRAFYNLVSTDIFNLERFQWSSTCSSFAPQGTFGIARHIFDCHNWEDRGGATGIYLVGRGQGHCHPTMHKTAPYNIENGLTQDVNAAEVEKLWSSLYSNVSKVCDIGDYFKE